MALARREDLSPIRQGLLDELQRIGEEFNRLMSRAFGDWPLADLSTAFTPPADIEETPDAYVVEVELPGIAKDDVDVEVQGRRLTVRAERKERERTGFWRSRTRVTGVVRYEALLPGEVDPDNVSARLADGVLTVRLAKPESERSSVKRIPVS
jgi:HSP20 family protein